MPSCDCSTIGTVERPRSARRYSPAILVAASGQLVVDLALHGVVGAVACNKTAQNSLHQLHVSEHSIESDRSAIHRGFKVTACMVSMVPMQAPIQRRRHPTHLCRCCRCSLRGRPVRPWLCSTSSGPGSCTRSGRLQGQHRPVSCCSWLTSHPEFMVITIG